MTNLDSILKSRDITLPTKVHLIKAMVFPVVMYRCENRTIKKVECQRIYPFELWCWRRLWCWESLGLQGVQTSPSSRKSVLNINWKDWFWSGNSNTLATWCEELTHWKRPWCWERMKAGGEGDDRGHEGWHYRLHGHEFERAPGDGEGQGSLVSCSPWGCRVRHDLTTEQQPQLCNSLVEN